MAQIRPPQSVIGVDFNEKFFDAAIHHAGGRRLTELYTPPPNTRCADYLVGDYIVELKILTLEPLERNEHQTAIAKLFTKHRSEGNLSAGPSSKQMRLTGIGSQQFWKILGKPIQRALESAEKQILATNHFLPQSKNTAVLLVNAGAASLDHPPSFINLAADYRHRYPAINAIFAFSAIPVPMEGIAALYFGIVDENGASHNVGGKIDEAIRLELDARTGKTSRPVSLDPSLNHLKPIFRVEPDRLRRL